MDFWKIDINDPVLAFGYCKIGKINTILIEGKEIKIPTSLVELNSFRQMIATSTVIDWEIK